MTKKMPGLFAKNPPKKPLTTLAALVDDWIHRFGAKGKSKHMRDEVVEYCREAFNLTESITRACASKRPNGNVHNHQSRVKEADRKFFATRIRRALDETRVENFDELHDLLEEIAPPGVGPVTVYDVATRIGAYLKMEPQSLYLHAGVRLGWNLLHGRRMPVDKRIPREQWPKALRKLPADEVEDMLCAYREFLKPELLK